MISILLVDLTSRVDLVIIEECKYGVASDYSVSSGQIVLISYSFNHF